MEVHRDAVVDAAKAISARWLLAEATDFERKASETQHWSAAEREMHGAHAKNLRELVRAVAALRDTTTGHGRDTTT
jgi:hypothetical protein